MAFFFGDEPKQFDLIAISAASLVFSLGLAFGIPGIREATTLVQKIVIILIAYDVLGGVIATLTESTNRYHDRQPKTRWLFYSVHFIQPLILFYFFDTGMAFFLFCWLFPVVSSIIVREFSPEGIQRTVAGILFVLGVLAYIYWIPQTTGVEWFGYAFMTKLILGYGIRHFPAGGPEVPRTTESRR